MKNLSVINTTLIFNVSKLIISLTIVVRSQPYYKLNTLILFYHNKLTSRYNFSTLYLCLSGHNNRNYAYSFNGNDFRGNSPFFLLIEKQKCIFSLSDP